MIEAKEDLTKGAEFKALLRRMVEIDYRYKHRHLPGSLSALEIIANIYAGIDREHDVFILSKGHSAASLYAVLESLGLKPDVTKVHPERDAANGIQITAGSLGHGLPIGVGMAWAKKLRGEPGKVHVLMGDGECLEGTTWESLHMAARIGLHDNLIVHVDDNGYQGSDKTLVSCEKHMRDIFPIITYGSQKGKGIKMFEAAPEKSVHLVSDEEFATIMKELQ
jgi:transketolase